VSQVAFEGRHFVFARRAVKLQGMQRIEGYEAARQSLLESNAQRAFSAQPEREDTVRAICEDVRRNGDDALLRYTRQFECPHFETANLRVTEAEIEAAWQSMPARAQVALQRAADNIEAFHRAQPVGDWFTHSPEGAFLGQRYTPVERAGMYAPNFHAAYPSTVLMLAIPARVAGVRELVLASPPSKDGTAHPVILAAAKVAGIHEIYRVGGAQGMAALAYGTPSIRAVDKIVGPGSIWVTLAKKYLYGAVGIDGLYGPSEVVVLADDTVGEERAEQLAADLIAQAEHGADSFVCFICTSPALCDAVLRAVEIQVDASGRAEILRQSLENSIAIVTGSTDEAVELTNLAAAEHVEIWSSDALALMPRVRDAGAIFLNTPVPLGDYIAGPSHTLPTGATARFAHGVGVETFLKRTSVVAAPPSAIAALAEDLAVIAELEDLPGHAAAVRRAAV
jgi:histidinol dehydrogenase